MDTASGGRGTVLVVDDNTEAIGAMQAVLAEAGYGVLSATNAVGGIAAAQECMPDVIFMDLAMGGMDGHAATTALKAEERTRHIPVIMVTAMAGINDKLRGLRGGADDYITKPFQREELLARLGVALRMKALRDQLREKNRQLAELSHEDGLTGLPNRGFIDRRLKEEVERARRYQWPLACMMLDLDRFKQVNDTFGHQAGDAVIRRLADIVRQSLRQSDVSGRYGGEEFLVISPHTTSEGAYAMGERIRQQVERTRLDAGGQQIACTVSIGVACAGGGGTYDPGWLVARADEALYCAKSQGRNRVSMAPLPRA